MIQKANLEVFANTLLELAKKDKNIIVVTSDSRGSGKLVQFGKELPNQIIEVGIAEQNLVGICAGLSSAGKKVFGVSPSSFLTARSLEQIKNDIAYSDHPVTLVGISAGISYGQLGSTHHSIHDLAVLRTIHNIDIVVPADNFETKEVIKKAVDYPKPLFIRFGKKPMLKIHEEHKKFQIGRAIKVTEGKDITFLAIGETVQRALLASQILKQKKIYSSVISMHTLKPFDELFFLKSISNTKALITIEEHSVSGGIGEKCASIILQNGLNLSFKIIGIPDEYMINGSQSDVLDYYDMEPNRLATIARKLINK
ncbi:transketolase family protein [Alphaproteobacteria bacterium]|nr:transketolase family protein [Alphaproteobacteria bacterium]